MTHRYLSNAQKMHERMQSAQQCTALYNQTNDIIHLLTAKGYLSFALGYANRMESKYYRTKIMRCIAKVNNAIKAGSK